MLVWAVGCCSQQPLRLHWGVKRGDVSVAMEDAVGAQIGSQAQQLAHSACCEHWCPADTARALA